MDIKECRPTVEYTKTSMDEVKCAVDVSEKTSISRESIWQ